jgi:hypothetical protein
VTVRGVLFIDANQYLDLYRTIGGEKLLAPLQEQQTHIFVTTQVVDEVQRQKVKITESFLAARAKEPKPNKTGVSSQHSRTDKAIAIRLLERLQRIHKKLSHDLLEQVSRSKDDVSKTLDSIFPQAVAHTDEELQRARARKERGNPPGKRGDSLGDQLSWEQILSKCKDKPILWIITRDSDYGTMHEGKIFLNAALYQDLALLYQSEPTVFCFDNIGDGLKHFADTTGAKAEKLPTPEETEQIKKEQESLPPLGWLTDDNDSGYIRLQLQDAFRMRESTPLAAPWISPLFSDEAIPPPPTKKVDEYPT